MMYIDARVLVRVYSHKRSDAFELAGRYAHHSLLLLRLDDFALGHRVVVFNGPMHRTQRRGDLPCHSTKEAGVSTPLLSAQ